MKVAKHYLPPVLFAGLLIALGFLVLWTSLDFQECVKTYGSGNPSGEHLEKGSSGIITTLLKWRHCSGAYAFDKNAVINALGTVVIAIFTTLLGVFTVRLAKSTRIAADAALDNAQAVINAERAYLFIEIRRQNVVDIIKSMAGSERTAPKGITIDYGFTNYGKTPAIIRAIGFGALITENLPRVREYSSVLHLPTHMLGAEKITKDLLFTETTISRAEADSIIGLQNTFWFYGYMTYDDMFGWERQLRFVFHVSGVSEGFTLYEYQTIDKKRES